MKGEENDKEFAIAHNNHMQRVKTSRPKHSTLQTRTNTVLDENKECKPSTVYDEFMENVNHKLLLETEKTRLNSFGMSDDDVVKKFKKTFKNRYFLKFK